MEIASVKREKNATNDDSAEASSVKTQNQVAFLPNNHHLANP